MIAFSSASGTFCAGSKTSSVSGRFRRVGLLLCGPVSDSGIFLHLTHQVRTPPSHNLAGVKLHHRHLRRPVFFRAKFFML